MYRMAAKVAGVVGDRPLEEVWFAFEALCPWSKRLTGQTLEGVETLGKALLLRFADGTTIYTHNQLYGRWMFSEAGRRPDTNQQLRLALSTDERSALHWQLRPGDLDDSTVRCLAGVAHTLMWRSVETGGLTNDPERVDALKRPGWRRRDYRHYLFGRDAQVCHACNTPIERTSVSGRRLYHCPTCQAPGDQTRQLSARRRAFGMSRQ